MDEGNEVVGGIIFVGIILVVLAIGWIGGTIDNERWILDVTQGEPIVIEKKVFRCTGVDL